MMKTMEPTPLTPSRRLLAVAALLAVLVSGCAATGETFKGFREPQPGKAEIIVFRESQFKGGANKHIIKLDGQVVGTLRNGGWISLLTEPGEHSVEYDMTLLKNVESPVLVVYASTQTPVVVQTMGRQMEIEEAMLVSTKPATTVVPIPVPSFKGPGRIREVPIAVALPILQTLKRSDD